MNNEKIKQLLAPIIESLGYIAWGVEFLSQGKHSLLRIYIDKETGITVDDCGIVSRQISHFLDVEDPIAGHYSLEISSPGIDRPLFEAWQYKAYQGHVVKVVLARNIDGKRKITGRIVEITEDGMLSLEVEEHCYQIPFEVILKANLCES